MFRSTPMTVSAFWLGLVCVGWALALGLGGINQGLQAAEPPPPSRDEVCAVATALPDAADTDAMLALLLTNRQAVVDDLILTGDNMARYNSEGYGWQNVIDGSGALPPQPGSWLLGALRMACESGGSSADISQVSGSVSYRQRIALPPMATLVVTLEDVSLADVAAPVIAQTRLQTGGQQVPIPFALTYAPGAIEAGRRYNLRAQIFYGDQLAWTSTRAYPVLTEGHPTQVNLDLEQV